jgi:flavin-binding protein dodecin
MDLACVSIGRKPLRHGVGFKESAVDTLRFGAQDAVQLNGFSRHDGDPFNEEAGSGILTADGGWRELPARFIGSDSMNDHVYKHLELTGSSTESIEAAVNRAIAKAHETVRNIQWFTITETRGHVTEGKVAHWQVTINVGFTLE